MNFKAVLSMVLELTGLAKFPFEPAAHVALARMVCEWARSEAEVRALIDVMLCDFDEWPGPRTFREIFNRLHRPQDGPPEHRPYPTTPLPDWFIDWSTGRPELPPADDLPELTPEQMDARIKEIAAKTAMPKPRPRSNVHTMPIVKPQSYVRSAEEQARMDQIARDIEQLERERAEQKLKDAG